MCSISSQEALLTLGRQPTTLFGEARASAAAKPGAERCFDAVVGLGVLVAEIRGIYDLTDGPGPGPWWRIAWGVEDKRRIETEPLRAGRRQVGVYRRMLQLPTFP